MILDFDNKCWSHNNDDWKRSLARLLVLLESSKQHSVLADQSGMLAWCDQHLQLFADYYKTRLAAAQPRSNALTIRVSPDGASVVDGQPPWVLDASAAGEVASRPLRLVLENDSADQLFITATVRGFASWCDKRWIQAEMGGGATMKPKIDAAAAHAVDRWRTFFMFDSDRLHPDEFNAGWTPPSGDGCQGHAFEVACASLPRRRWHRLQRRAIENYLPAAVLQRIKPATSESLGSTDVGSMAHYYNMKKGLDGDEFTTERLPNATRWARTRGFWANLKPENIAALREGFGRKVSDQFSNIPASHPWPPDVIAEMNALADALQDAM